MEPESSGGREEAESQGRRCWHSLAAREKSDDATVGFGNGKSGHEPRVPGLQELQQARKYSLHRHLDFSSMKTILDV